jgi:hypothetical protein
MLEHNGANVVEESLEKLSVLKKRQQRSEMHII